MTLSVSRCFLCAAFVAPTCRAPCESFSMETAPWSSYLDGLLCFRVTRPTPGTPQWGPTAENCFFAVGRPTAEDSTAGDYAAVGEAQQAARAGVAGATGGARRAARLCTWVNGL